MPTITGQRWENVKVHRPNGTRWAYGYAGEPARPAPFLAEVTAMSIAYEKFRAEFGRYPDSKVGKVVIEVMPRPIGVTTAHVYEVPWPDTEAIRARNTQIAVDTA